MTLPDFGFQIDFSRANISDTLTDTFQTLIEKRQPLAFFERMREGAIVNPDENAQALHTSLRRNDAAFPHQEEVLASLERIKACTREVRQRIAAGDITDIVNIGVGGSSLGPEVLWQAFKEKVSTPRVHFLTAADSYLFERITKSVNPTKTLVIINSKSMRTRETLLNAQAFFEFLARSGLSSQAIADATYCVSADPRAYERFGLEASHAFPLWPWVGGRFSVWSAVSLCVIFAFGFEFFSDFLSGARQADDFTMKAPDKDNLALKLALLTYAQLQSGMLEHCLLPYDERLRKLPFWLQQLEMESLGKCRNLKGKAIADVTGQLLWSVMANEGQHSVFQYLRDINRSCAITVFSVTPSHDDIFAKYQRLNVSAQLEALCAKENAHANSLLYIAFNHCTPASLGALMALFEAKTVLLAALFGINPFHQPSVEFGKKRLNALFEENP